MDGEQSTTADQNENPLHSTSYSPSSPTPSDSSSPHHSLSPHWSAYVGGPHSQEASNNEEEDTMDEGAEGGEWGSGSNK